MCGLRSLFDSQNDLDELGIWALKVNPDPVLIATEGALWGSVKAHGFLYSRQSALTMIALGFAPITVHASMYLKFRPRSLVTLLEQLGTTADHCATTAEIARCGTMTKTLPPKIKARRAA